MNQNFNYKTVVQDSRGSGAGKSKSKTPKNSPTTYFKKTRGGVRTVKPSFV